MKTPKAGAPVRRLATALIGGLSVGAAAAVADAPDPPGLARFLGAVVVAYSPVAPLRAYEFITGHVDRSRRELRIDRSVRVPAALVRVTYQTPDGTRLRDVEAHYRAQTEGLREVFSCRGRDCGRSNAWANDVFRVKELVAPDTAQRYFAVAGADELIAIYMVQRGNRRVYVHVDRASGDGIGAFARPVEAPATAAPTAGGPIAAKAGFVATLERRGFVLLPAAAPAATGDLGVGARQALDGIAAELAGLDRTVYVVCHLAGDAATATERAAACAARAAARLRANGVRAEGFGAGPFLPRPNAPRSRLELVLP